MPPRPTRNRPVIAVAPLVDRNCEERSGQRGGEARPTREVPTPLNRAPMRDSLNTILRGTNPCWETAKPFATHEECLSVPLPYILPENTKMGEILGSAKLWAGA